MEFTLKVQPEHINQIFAGLNKLEHGAIRQTFDYILKQVQEQELAAMQAAKASAPEATPEAGLND